jgi:oligopeptide transport system substrate-binding protein
MNFFLPVIVAFLFMLIGCSSDHSNSTASTSPDILRINIGQDPSTLDPRKARSLCDRTIMNMLFEGLTRINREEKAEPALAQVIEVSSDLMTYTFYLRNAKWTNGEQVKASDFAYAWKKILDPSFASDNSFQLYPIKNAQDIKKGKMHIDLLGVEVIDDLTLKVTLEQPTPYFLELTAFPAFFPVCEAADRLNPFWAEKETTAVYCGPFKLQKWRHSDEIKVVKNENYWDAASVKLSEIVMCMVKEETEVKMFEKRELDWIGSPLSTIPVDALKSFKDAQGLQTKPMLGTYFFRMNTSNDFLCNVNIRKALAIAIDRAAIVDHVLQGNQKPATGLVPTSMGLQKGPYFQDHDVEEARALFQKGIEEIGIDKNHFSQLTLIFPSGERSYLIAQAVQQQWMEAFGLTVKIQSLEKKVYFDALSKECYDIAAGSWIADFNDPINFLEVFKHKFASTNHTCWENDSYIRLLDESKAISDPDERKMILAQSEDLLIKNMPIIPIFYYNMLYASDSKVKEMVLSSMGNLDFKWAHVDDVK